MQFRPSSRKNSIAFQAGVLGVTRFANKVNDMSHFSKFFYFFGANTLPMKSSKAIITTVNLSWLFALKANILIRLKAL